MPKRLPLNYARGEVLISLLDPYLRAALQKGVPPLFTDILSLYDDPERIKIIENLMYGYLKNLKETGHLCETGERLVVVDCITFTSRLSQYSFCT